MAANSDMPISFGKRKKVRLYRKVRECSRVECSKIMKRFDEVVVVEIREPKSKGRRLGKDYYCSLECLDRDEADAVAAS